MWLRVLIVMNRVNESDENERVWLILKRQMN